MYAGKNKMRKTLLYKDKAGNKLLAEGTNRVKLAVRNREGKLINTQQTHQFIRKAIKEKPSIQQHPAFKKTEREGPSRKTGVHSDIIKVRNYKEKDPFKMW